MGTLSKEGSQELPVINSKEFEKTETLGEVVKTESPMKEWAVMTDFPVPGVIPAYWVPAPPCGIPIAMTTTNVRLTVAMNWRVASIWQ